MRRKRDAISRKLYSRFADTYESSKAKIGQVLPFAVWSMPCAEAIQHNRRFSAQGSRFRATGGPIEQFNCVHDRHVCCRPDLHHAADIASRDNVR